MSDPRSDAIASFYDQHPYPPPVADLARLATERGATGAGRVEHHRIWPHRPPSAIRRLLVAGCGTAQAARHALRDPSVEVVGIDVSRTSIEHTRRLIAQHDIANLRVELLPIEDVASLGMAFDRVVCTGVLHHLADPATGLRALASVLEPNGAITVMVYARFGRVGIEMLQEYCRLLGVTPSPADIADLVATLRELPMGHPVSRLLRETRDFQHDDAVADALLNPRERSYTVDDVFDLLAGAGLRFGRWVRQAPYLPDCGSISETPHRDRLLALTEREQFSAMERFRGTIDRHTAIAFRRDDDVDVGPLSSTHVTSSIPIVDPAAVAIEDADRLPPGAAAALLNRGHTTPDVIVFAADRELAWFRSIDGRQTVSELGIDPAFVERLWRHDLLVLDTTGARSPDSSER